MGRYCCVGAQLQCARRRRHGMVGVGDDRTREQQNFASRCRPTIYDGARIQREPLRIKIR
jgi:hypothetical protein